MHIVDLGQLIKIQKLVVDPVFQAVVPGRDQPGDSAGDLYRPVVFQHRHPLVALLHIEPVHELKGNDGRVDALFQVGLAEVGPLGGKLGVRLQQRHEVGRKGCVSPAGLGAHDALSRDLHQTQRLLRYDVHIDQNIVQHRKIGRLAACHAGTIGALSGLQRVFVIFQHNLLLSSPVGRCAAALHCSAQYTMKISFMGDFVAQKC